MYMYMYLCACDYVCMYVCVCVCACECALVCVRVIMYVCACVNKSKQQISLKKCWRSGTIKKYNQSINGLIKNFKEIRIRDKK